MASGILVPAAATITATSAVATAGFAWGTFRAVKRHDRALYGSDRVEQWDGLIPTVDKHEQALEDEDIL